MPRIAPLSDNIRRDNAIRGELARAMAESEYDNAKIASALKISPKTLIFRKNRPGTFRLAEIRALQRLFPGIKID